MSKYKEAIEAIKSNYPPENYTMLREGLDLAIEALEKQIPKKPIEYECPVCKDSVGYKFGESYMMPHCENCGQKLDWEV